MATSSITVGYWGTRGRGGVLRNLLSYCGLPYENKVYSDMTEWFGKDKKNLGFEFPNLPYLIDGDKKITETTSILHYIPIRAGKRELLGNTDEEYIEVEVALGVVQDLTNEVLKLAFTKGDFKTEKEDSFTKGAAKAKLEALNKNLKDKDWLCGFLSIADFTLFEIVDLIYEMDPVKLEAYPNVMKFYRKFLDIPQVKAHRQSNKFLRVWFIPGMTAWNNM